MAVADLLLVLLLAAANICKTAANTAQYSTTKLNVHLVSHTHDDVGWLKTVNQYYYGTNNSIQHAGVQYILDSVVHTLQRNVDRKFVYVEQAFFQHWLSVQDDSTLHIIKQLISNGQFEFINGGWCMHDEATTYYLDMIDQTTHGHTKLLRQFDVVPLVGWQIDPFGHSSTQATLLGADMGFHSLMFGRMDYADLKKRISEKNMVRGIMIDLIMLLSLLLTYIV